MDITHRDWESLPAELLYMILRFAATKQSKVEVCNTALVCKAWKSTAQTVAYSHITIDSVSRFKKFYNVISRSPELGVKVKTLNLPFHERRNEKIEVSQRLTSLLTTSLPNLELLNKENLHTCVSTLNNLLNCKLKKLRRLQYPYVLIDKKAYDKYVNCAFTMKERLENVYIDCTKPQRSDYSYTGFQRMYNTLYQFNNLVDIKISLETNDSMQDLEYVVESCKSLKNIDIDLYHVEPNNVVSTIGDMSKYVPTQNIKLLKVSAYGGKDYQYLLSYIMHKFTKLQNLILNLLDSNSLFNAYLVTQLLSYVSAIDKVSANGILMNQNNIMKTIGTYWQNTRKPGSEKLYISYFDYFPEYTDTSLHIRKIVGEEGIKIGLDYPINVDLWGAYTDFIEKSGKYIGTLSLNIDVEDDRLDSCELPETFFPRTLASCPNLRSLRFECCYFKLFSYPETGLNNKSSIDDLHLEYCQIQNGAFEQLSPLFREIKQLRLYCNDVYLPENEQDDTPNDFQITMPHTDINHIMILLDKYERDIYVEVFVSSDRKCYYYRASNNGQNDWINLSTKEEFLAASTNQHIYVSCVTKPILEAKRFEYYIMHDRIFHY